MDVSFYSEDHGHNDAMWFEAELRSDEVAKGVVRRVKHMLQVARLLGGRGSGGLPGTALPAMVLAVNGGNGTGTVEGGVMAFLREFGGGGAALTGHLRVARESPWSPYTVTRRWPKCSGGSGISVVTPLTGVDVCAEAWKFQNQIQPLFRDTLAVIEEKNISHK